IPLCLSREKPTFSPETGRSFRLIPGKIGQKSGKGPLRKDYRPILPQGGVQRRPFPLGASELAQNMSPALLFRRQGEPPPVPVPAKNRVLRRNAAAPGRRQQL